MKEKFEQFLEELQIDNKDDIDVSLNDIARKLNKKYYENSTTDNYVIVGSMGRKTSIKGESDIDIIYELLDDVFKRFDNYKDNGQSKLLQEIKNELLTKYKKTKIVGDGQVVVIPFNKYTIELVPGFIIDENTYKYPDTHDGGSWKETKPILEINESINIINSTNTYLDLCQMIREWKANNGVTICGLLIDTLVYNFLNENEKYKNYTKDNYYELLMELFKYLSEENESQIQWNALGSNQIIKNNNFNFIKKSKKAFNKMSNSENNLETLIDLFGIRFPSDDIHNRSYGYSQYEQFIEDLYPIYIKYNLKIDCKISQDGFRTSLLSEFIKKHFKIKHNKKLEFYIKNLNVKDDYEIYWKVRNVGFEAIKRDCLRGEIKLGGNSINETSNFYGPHFVECYIVQNGICVARDRIIVPIDVD